MRFPLISTGTRLNRNTCGRALVQAEIAAKQSGGVLANSLGLNQEGPDLNSGPSLSPLLVEAG